MEPLLITCIKATNDLALTTEIKVYLPTTLAKN